MNFSENIKKLRKENNLSQEELAEKLNVSRQSVSKWESNSAYPEMDKIIQISNMFNVGIDELLNKDIREVQEEKQVKSNINKYIDDFLSFISKSIDMFLNMKFKDKCKFIFEECFIAFILWVLFAILGSLLSNIFYHAFGFISNNVLYNIHNFLGGIYSALAICLGVIIILHIYKTRYLDYYVIVDKEEIEKDSDNKDDKSEVVNEAKKELSVKREKVIIRDPDHSSYKFINGLLKAFLILVKINVFFIFLGFCSSFIGLAVSLILSFLISKTGLFFVGILLCIISCMVLNYLVINVLFNFIISHKIKWKLLFIMFISSLFVLGSGIGMTTVGFTKFDLVEDYSVVDEKIIPMREDYIVHDRYDGNELEYIESDNSDLRITVSHSKDMYSSIEVTDNYINAYAYSNYDNVFEVIRGQLDEINKMKIHNYDRYKVTIYTTKENIETLKNNYNRFIEGE